MRLVRNTGSDRIVDELQSSLVPGAQLDIASPFFSLFAFAHLRELLKKLSHCRFVLPVQHSNDLGLLGSELDRPFRNHLQVRWLVRQCADWLQKGGSPIAPPLIYLNLPSSPDTVTLSPNASSPEVALSLPMALLVTGPFLCKKEMRMNEKLLGFSWNLETVAPPPRPQPAQVVCHGLRRMLAQYVWDAAVLEGNPFTFVQVQTVLDGVIRSAVTFR